MNITQILLNYKNKYTNALPIYNSNFDTYTCTHENSSGSAASAGKGHTKSASVSSPRASTDGCVSVSIDPLGTRYTQTKSNKRLFHQIFILKFNSRANSIGLNLDW